MARRSDRKSTPNSESTDLSRRSFIERVAGASVTAPALVTLTGSWLMAESAFAAGQSSSKGSLSSSLSSSGSEASYSIPSSASSAAESSFSGSSSSGPPTTAYAIADTTLRHDSPHTNEGSNPRIRVGARPVRRGVVAFDPFTVEEMRFVADCQNRVYLTLQIAANGNNWSQTEDHYVDVHPLPLDFVLAEGDGRFSGLPLAATTRGNGSGATWHVPVDSQIADTKPGKKEKKSKTKPVKATPWNGASDVMGEATAQGVLHVNGLAGYVSWDVTDDVMAGSSAWIVKLRDEHDPLHEGTTRRQGFDPFRGSVDYYSREGAAAEIGVATPPQLQLVTFNTCGGGESSASGSASAESALASE
ncbi:MAG: hypothetical protein AB7P34_04660 [Vicinamibacterales bacterium]